MKLKNKYILKSHGLDYVLKKDKDDWYYFLNKKVSFCISMTDDILLDVPGLPIFTVGKEIENGVFVTDIGGAYTEDSPKKGYIKLGGKDDLPSI